ncbi:MAG: hypothetical protein AAFO96_14955 [Bacteroidota bacterium]
MHQTSRGAIASTRLLTLQEPRHSDGATIQVGRQAFHPQDYL